MKLQTIIHAEDSMKDVAERLVKENLENKLDSYLKQFDKKEDVEWEITLTLEKNTREEYNGKLHIFIDWKTFNYWREDYKNLDDLINHLFKHFKEEVSK